MLSTVAVVDEPVLVKLIWRGAHGYVTKPFNADTPMHAVRTVVGLPEAPAASTDLWLQTQAR